MKKKILIAVIVIIILIGGAVLGGYLYIKHKLGYVNYEPIDESTLEKNENLYNEVETTGANITESEFKEIQNILFFGSDSRDTSDASAGRSDSIMVCSLNPVKKSIKLISIPRDTYVTIDGYGKTKVNHAYAYGGEQLSIKTINQNFGLSIDKYVTVDFSGLVNIINDVGGIELTISKDEMSIINGYLKEIYRLLGEEYKPMTEYGTVTLSGEEALAHSRNRYVGNDFTRASRQRDVLMALMKKMSTMEKSEILDLSDKFLQEVKTNLTSDEILSIITGVFASKDEYMNNIYSVQIPSTDYANGQTIDGVYYFVSDISKAKADFIEYIYNK